MNVIENMFSSSIITIINLSIWIQIIPKMELR